MSKTTTPPIQPVTRQEIEQMSLQYGRLLDLRDQTIVNPNRDAEIKGIIEYLSQMFIDHASEFIGCQVAIRDEYEPWLNLQVVQRERMNAIAGQRLALRESQVPPPANVVPLVDKKGSNMVTD